MREVLRLQRFNDRTDALRQHPGPRRRRLHLAGLLRAAGFDDVASTLTHALLIEMKIQALSIADREAILRALEDCPDGLAELRGVLLREHE